VVQGEHCAGRHNHLTGRQVSVHIIKQQCQMRVSNWSKFEDYLAPKEKSNSVTAIKCVFNLYPCIKWL